LLDRVERDVIGDCANLSIASRGKEQDDKTFNSKFYVRKAAQNELKAEQKAKLNQLRKQEGLK
jgi:hypothetical protein